MGQEKRILKDISNSLLIKKQKKTEALQELVHIRPDLKGKTVYFFPTLDKYFEGILMFDAKEKKAYVYSVKNDHKYESFSKWMNGLKKRGLFKGNKSALATIFLEPNPTSLPIASILNETDYSPYWKSIFTNIKEILVLIQKEILPGGKFSGMAVQEVNEGLEFNFYERGVKSEKKLIIKTKGILLEYEVCILDQILQETYLPFPTKAMKRTLNEIESLIQYVFSLKICHGQSTKGFEDVIHVRGTQLVNNKQNDNKEHTPFAFLEKQGQPDEAYRRIDCLLVVKDKNICENCEKLRKTMQQICRRLLTTNSSKIVHASKDILIEKVKKQQKFIKMQHEKISSMKKYLQKKIELEEAEISDEMANVVHIVAKNVASKQEDISNLHPIFQELIRIQTKKSNGVRYHPMFLSWAISVYSKSGNAAYNAMKTIMRLPSISTLKNYINENEQCSGWQDKIADQILANLTINKIWGYGRVGFFSHDSFKIQKGLLWDQRKNCYVGYLDFENEMQDYETFAIQCQHEIESTNSLSNLSIPNEQKYDLSTQVHQIIWHSISHNFSYPISYYGINNMKSYNLNILIFSLAAKLECIDIHTIGSICDGAGENRIHIKSFDWYASKWTSGEIVEVNFNKDKKSFHAAKILNTNYEKTKFTVCLCNSDKSENITVDRAFIRPPMPSKSEWNINEICEFRNPNDNQWHLGKITGFDPVSLILTVEITNAEGVNEGWQVFNYHIDNFLRPVYDSQKLSTSYKTINPITGEDWFFISDPTHVFKKLRNNLSKSHTGEKSSREIMLNGKEISWKHIKGVYEHTNLHATAKATKLTKRHIWLTSWSKMRVDLAEHTLSKEVEDALASIESLKKISKETRNFIRYSRKYRQIMHSKINFQSLEDPRINTLKEIQNWFIYGDKQKTESKEWISSQCQFDLILSINGFLGMIEYFFKKYPGSIAQPKRISQDVLEGLFGIIREFGGDSSTHTLKSYGHALNKYQVTALVSSEIKSFNYGKADSTGTGVTTLIRRDYRKDKKIINIQEDNYMHQKHFTRLGQLSSLSQSIFKNILADNLIMGRIKIPSESYNKNVDQDNFKIIHLQNERCNLIETILYKDSIDELLQKWQNIIRKIAQEAIPKKIGIQWLANWRSHLENNLNNFKCSGIWYQDFLTVVNLNGSLIQRHVAYFLLQEVIKLTFSEKITNSLQIHLSADSYITPEKIIILEPAEASKFSYIVGWIVYKLTKSDKITKSQPEFEVIKSHLMILNSEQVVYEQDVRSQTTNVIPGQEFLEFMYKMESLVLLLFEKHKEFGPNILQYIHNSLLCNIPLLEAFNTLLNISSQMLSMDELKDDVKNFLYERIISIYMKSRQKSWRRFNEFTPEKGTSSLRENLKAMRNDTQHSTKIENNKHILMKKSNIPTNPTLGLVQLRIWAQFDCAIEEFSKMFSINELQWLLWAFGDNIKCKRKKSLIPLIIDHLKKETPFSEQAISKGQIFAEK